MQLLLVREFFVGVTTVAPTDGGAGAIRIGLIRGCVTFGVRPERVLFAGDTVCDCFLLRLFGVIALSNSAIASFMANSNWEFNFRPLVRKINLISFTSNR